MKRFTIVKLFLSLGILFLSAAFSGPDVARGQQSLNAVAAPLCAPPCVKERVLARLCRYFPKSPLLNISLISSGLSKSSLFSSSASFISRIN